MKWKSPSFPRGTITTATIAAAGVAMSALAAASDVRPVPLAERVQGASRVVVATASTVNASWRETPSGDKLIVSRVALHVEETLKGAATPTALLDIEGGTVDGIELRVSSLPSLTPGERGVFFLDAAGNGVYQSHLRGQGILKLDERDFVKGSSLQLDEIRRVASSLSR